MKYLIALVLCALVGCSSSADFCPRGYRAVREQDRCVLEVAMNDAPTSSETSEAETSTWQEIEEADGSGLELDASEQENVSEQDAGEGLSFDMDATAPPTQLDGDMDAVNADEAFVDVQGTLADAAPVDVEWVDAPDGMNDASLFPPCSEQDVMRWGEGHRSEGLRALITGCGIPCDGGIACADECARRASGVATCNECTRTEVACIARWCVDACGPASTDGECLTCICGADCVATFEQCSGHTLAVCAESQIGVSNDAGTRPLSSLGLLFARSATGLTVSAQLDRLSCEMAADRRIGFLPAGPRRFLSVSMPEGEVVFVYSASCAAPPCEAHAYTLSETGTFDAHVYESRWDADFSDLEIFSLRGARYLLRVRDDGATPTRDAADDLLIDRLEWGNANGVRVLRTVPVSRGKLLTPIRQRYTQAEAFAVGDDVFLFLLSPITGENRFLRVQQEGTGLELVPASPALVWSSGWDLVESFKSFGTWYLLAFKTGRLRAAGELAGTIRIWQPTLDSQRQLGLGSPVYGEFWGSPGLDHVAAFTGAQGEANLALYNSAQGALIFARLAQDYTVWPSQSFGLNNAIRWYTRPPVPPWDTMEMYGHGQW